MKKWDEGANTQMDDHHYESESKSKENESSMLTLGHLKKN